MRAEDTPIFAPVFERLGRQLDAAIFEPELDRFFPADSRQLLVVISGTEWRNAALFAAYSEKEVGSIMVAARCALEGSLANFATAGFAVELADCVMVAWAAWLARKGIRTAGAEIFDNPPDLQVGSLLQGFPAARDQIDEIVTRGASPVVGIALDSTGLKRARPKCGVRVVVFPLPDWACPAGAVAGHA